MKKRKATPLYPGAKVGLTAPASPVRNQAEIERAARLIRELGLEPVLGATAKPGMADLSGTDLERHADLEWLWRDPAVAAVWALRGGYGCIRLLPRLNYRMMAEQPKILIGYSDVTALEMGIWTHSRLITFHGSVLNGLDNRFSLQQATDLLFGRFDTGQLPWPAGSREYYSVIREGRAQGFILGGNLTTLLSLAGTQFFPDLNGAILFLEEVGEAAYRIDRMLQQLMLMGALEEVAAVLIGRTVPFQDERETDLIDLIRKQLNLLPCPSAYGFPIGHAGEQWTLPQGIWGEADLGNGGLTLLESPFESEPV